MTQTPALMIATRPDVPAAGTPEYARWRKEMSLSYAGGNLTSAYGNLIQTINFAEIPFACGNVDTITVSVGAASPVLTIGQPPITRKAYTYTKKKYHKKNSSLAAAGEQVRVVTDVGEYTARLTGTMEALATYFCANSSYLYGDVTIYSPSGAAYSFTPTIA